MKLTGNGKIIKGTSFVQVTNNGEKEEVFYIPIEEYKRLNEWTQFLNNTMVKGE